MKPRTTTHERAATGHAARRLHARGMPFLRDTTRDLYAGHKHPFYGFAKCATLAIVGVHDGSFYCSPDDKWAVY